ncbi:MAG: antibiotic biosynthesis monooxygenase family protein [Actinomycetaceae bacterium]|nr:antibiotic biosynthesis monooxygenase family protein [Actinomycetaceae bacterium]MDU0970613.1 antibiotic biosynthesis monooxygenase family protein [Actinomycetaceae bacterium]
MSIVKINEITVPAGGGDQITQRFQRNAATMEGIDGFEGFELLRPTDDSDVWMVVTHWRDEDAYQGWLTGPAFAAAHGHKAGEAPSPHRPKPTGTSSRVRAFEVAVSQQ